jgi:hypothetical protein
MEIKYSREVPSRIEGGGVKRTLNYNIKELTESELNELWERESNREDMNYESWKIEHKYAYNSVTIGNARWTYSGVVEAIIREKYSIDEMEAITNNMSAINAVFMQTLVTDGIVGAIKYLKDSADSEDTNTFKEMQEWRQLAKNEAKEIFNK